MSITDEDFERLQCLEEEMWREETRFNIKRMNDLIADDFFEFGRSGRVYQKQDTLSISPEIIEAILPLPALRVRLIDENIAQVTYDSAVKYGGVIQYAHRSSI